MEIVLILSQVISWLHIVIFLLLMILAATRSRLRGKLFLMFFLAGGFITTFAWRIIDILIRSGRLDPAAGIYEWLYIPIAIFSFISFCSLIPFVLIAPVPETIKQEQEIY